MVFRQNDTSVYDGSAGFGADYETAVKVNEGFGPGTWLCAGWVHDPGPTVTRIDFRGQGVDGDPSVSGAGVLEELHRVPRPEVTALFRKHADSHHGNRHGFLALVRSASETVPSLILSQQNSEHRLELTPKQVPQASADRLNAILGALPREGLGDDLFNRLINPPVSRLQKARVTDVSVARALSIGNVPAQPAISLIVPVYRDLRYLEALVLGLARDPASTGSELLFVLDSPDDEMRLWELIRALHEISGQAFRLLVHNRNGGFARAVNTGIEMAQAPLLVMLNADVVPADGSALTNLIAAVEAAEQGQRLAGARLLYPDGSLQHAGMSFRLATWSRWHNIHYFKGFPGNYAPALVGREVPAVTGAVWAMHADVVRRCGNLDEGYVTGDFEDSDFCLRAAEQGISRYYAANSVWYHFERQSMRQHASHKNNGSAHFNRWRHHRRWSVAMGRLAQDFDDYVPRTGPEEPS